MIRTEVGELNKDQIIQSFVKLSVLVNRQSGEIRNHSRVSRRRGLLWGTGGKNVGKAGGTKRGRWAFPKLSNHRKSLLALRLEEQIWGCNYSWKLQFLAWEGTQEQAIVAVTRAAIKVWKRTWLLPYSCLLVSSQWFQLEEYNTKPAIKGVQEMWVASSLVLGGQYRRQMWRQTTTLTIMSG